MRITLLDRVTATPAERSHPLPGDAIVPMANVVMDRAFTVPGTPVEVFPWLVQLGKARAGWYLPSRLERVLPRGHRAIRALDPRWGALHVGDVIPDYGGPRASFTVASIEAPTTLVYSSERGATRVSWAITVGAPVSNSVSAARHSGEVAATPSCRVHLRLRLGGVKHPRLADSLGGLFDAVTILGMALGLIERLGERSG